MNKRPVKPFTGFFVFAKQFTAYHNRLGDLPGRVVCGKDFESKKTGLSTMVWSGVKIHVELSCGRVVCGKFQVLTLPHFQTRVVCSKGMLWIKFTGWCGLQ